MGPNDKTPRPKDKRGEKKRHSQHPTPSTIIIIIIIIIIMVVVIACRDPNACPNPGTPATVSPWEQTTPTDQPANQAPPLPNRPTKPADMRFRAYQTLTTKDWK